VKLSPGKIKQFETGGRFMHKTGLGWRSEAAARLWKSGARRSRRFNSRNTGAVAFECRSALDNEAG
jgi:hypothetical protein